MEETRRLAVLAGGAGFTLCGIVSLFTFQSEFQGRIKVPIAWSYVLQVIFPLIGFLGPWCLIRGLGWVLAGFLQPWPEKITNT